ncbi:MAG: NAD-dependent deacylase [Planctomycetes bacterium]|nr:NAD-dependent deacylase [Planctomycetota bacterium]
MDRARTLIEAAEQIVAFSGAGLSAESGVPTFRDAATGGLWEGYDPTRLASPGGFAADPGLVVEWYNGRRRAVHRALPNPAHRALAARADVMNVTQNVDDLLDRAGARSVVRLHGQLALDRCHGGCGYEETVDLGDPPPLRECPHCGARLRPGVVWFGESLPIDAWAIAESACRTCDVLLVVGTSAEVYPAAGLIALAKGEGARIVVINTNPSAASDLADVELIGKAGEIVPGLLER